MAVEAAVVVVVAGPGVRPGGRVQDPVAAGSHRDGGCRKSEDCDGDDEKIRTEGHICPFLPQGVGIGFL